MSRKENRAKELKRYGVNKLVENYMNLEEKLDKLEVAQMAFQEKLIAAIEVIEKRPFWKRLFGYRKLVNRLISTIRKGFKK